ncbi:MAG: hypothetical protein ACXV5J_11670 [Candidatus Angelobacter sp.]
MPVPPDRYADKSWNETLEHYRTRLPAATLLFPSAALGMLQKLSNSTDGRMLVLAADKGLLYEEDLALLQGPPQLEFHASSHCFSQLVNFDAIARYFYGIGGDALLPQKRFSSLSICAFLAHHSDDKFPATRAAYQETQSTFGPDDLFALMSWLNAPLEEVSIGQALALLRLTRWDTTAFLRLFPVIWRQLRSVAAERNDLRQAVLNTWANRYPVSPAENVLAFNCSVVLLELRFFAEALPLFKSPSICLGVPLPPVTTWGCAFWGSADPQTRWLIWSTPAIRIPPSSRPGTHESGWKKRKPRADCHEARPRNSAIQSCWAAAACIGNKNQPCSAFAATPLICTTSIYTQENCSRGKESCAIAPLLCFCCSAFCSPAPPGAGKTASPTPELLPPQRAKSLPTLIAAATPGLKSM